METTRRRKGPRKVYTDSPEYEDLDIDVDSPVKRKKARARKNKDGGGPSKKPPMFCTWSDEARTQMITEVEKRPVLWNASLKEERNARDVPWEEVALIMSEFRDKETGAHEVQSQWKNLRDSYRRYARKELSRNDGWISSWKWRQKLKFLDDVLVLEEAYEGGTRRKKAAKLPKSSSTAGSSAEAIASVEAHAEGFADAAAEAFDGASAEVVLDPHAAPKKFETIQRYIPQHTVQERLQQQLHAEIMRQVCRCLPSVARPTSPSGCRTSVTRTP
ncbi:hypothetical protein L596_001076 [Steinernema carpocapsae]|uniref:MADF domain-containing protein n=1 Tax=Steinernema carpocapsae TaxID=34508 RepID=A0A4U8UMJ5_STECR|nr:hypothetical protein L596_001076 [Steinernema carpocapsae]